MIKPARTPRAGAAEPGEPEGSIWRVTPFEALTVRELQNIYRARQAVFVVEQACPFIDADGLDERAHHLACWSALGAEPLAYARLLEPGAKYVEASIGRVLTTADARGTGLGRQLMRRALVHARHTWPGVALRISAQSRLEAFYRSFGFVAVGPPYLEDGIDHTEMLRPVDSEGDELQQARRP